MTLRLPLSFYKVAILSSDTAHSLGQSTKGYRHTAVVAETASLDATLKGREYEQ